MSRILKFPLIASIFQSQTPRVICRTGGFSLTSPLFSKMASTSVSADTPLASILRKSFPSIPDAQDGQWSSKELSKYTYPSTAYTDPERAEIDQWLITSSHLASADESPAKTQERLLSLNTHLSTRTTALGSKPSVADIALFARLAPLVTKWSKKERTGEKGYHHIVRHLDFVQNATETFGLKLDESEKVDIDVDDVVHPIPAIDPKAEKERKKKEKEAAAAAAAGGQTKDLPVGQGKKDKGKSRGEAVAAAVGASTPGVAQPSDGGLTKEQQKEKKKADRQPKQQKNAPAPEKPLSPALIDLRVGHILKAERHPNADSLYVSTIACGDKPGSDNTSEYEGKVVRTVCSGLNGLIPLEEMQNRKIVAVCNLKPVTMRGIKSAAMVLAASPRLEPGAVDDHKGPVELVNPPEGSEAGDRVAFEGFDGEPEGQLNPKKKVWEDCQVGFTTTDGCEIAFDPSAVEKLKGEGKGIGMLKTSKGVCSVKTLKNATVR